MIQPKHPGIIRLLFIATVSFFWLNGVASELRMNKLQQKVIIVSVDTKGNALIGRDTFDLEGLTHELQQRFWKSFTGTGKMQDAIKLESIGEVPPDIRKSVTDAIIKAQQNALTELCLQLHKKRFDELSSRQQEKIKRNYKILFQQNFLL